MRLRPRFLDRFFGFSRLGGRLSSMELGGVGRVQYISAFKEVILDTNLAIAAFAATVSFVFMVWAVGRA
jgi:hypothetical protein